MMKSLWIMASELKSELIAAVFGVAVAVLSELL